MKAMVNMMATIRMIRESTQKNDDDDDDDDNEGEK